MVTDGFKMLCGFPQRAWRRQFLVFTGFKWDTRPDGSLAEHNRFYVYDGDSNVTHEVGDDGGGVTCGFVGDGDAFLALVDREKEWQIVLVDWRTSKECIVARDVGDRGFASWLAE